MLRKRVLDAELVKYSLIYLAEEMGVALRRSAYSPNITERADHSCVILDVNSRVLAQAEHIPVHLGSMPVGLRGILNYLDENGIELKEGDVILSNDPYITGTHLNDVTVIQPVYYEGRLVVYVANKAHYSDVGGANPASISAEAEEIYQEGLLIPPVKIVSNGKVNREALSLLLSNVRMPHVALGDLHAQLAANLTGVKGVKKLIDRRGLRNFTEAYEIFLEQTAEDTGAEYRSMPEGEYYGEDFLESASELLDNPVRIAVKVTIEDEQVKLDFSASDTQVKGPVNTVYGVTVAASTFAVRTLFRKQVSINDGFYRTVKVYAPEGSVVNATRPYPVSAGNVETSQRIVDAIYRALHKAMPDRVPAASCGSMNNIMIGGPGWAFYETIGGGYGGRTGKDGVDGVHVNMTNTMNTPIEMLEKYYPILFTTYKLRENSMGHGEYRGGCGIERAFKALEKITATIVGERTKLKPWGVNGGTEAKPAEYLVRRSNNQVTKLKPKHRITLAPGDELIIRTAGGGGYGPPEKRPTEKIRKDIENGLLTPDEALKNYPNINQEDIL